MYKSASVLNVTSFFSLTEKLTYAQYFCKKNFEIKLDIGRTLGPWNPRYLSPGFPNLVSTTLVSHKQSSLLFEDMHNINANLKKCCPFQAVRFEQMKNSFHDWKGWRAHGTVWALKNENHFRCL